MRHNIEVLKILARPTCRNDQVTKQPATTRCVVTNVGQGPGPGPKRGCKGGWRRFKRRERKSSLLGQGPGLLQGIWEGAGILNRCLGVHGSRVAYFPQLAGFGHESEWATRDVRPPTYSLLVFPHRSHPRNDFSRLPRESP